ncbi:MAG: Asp23/Gls24 family envelope stress response protein [Lachnoanaerobaculum sp.]|jgi:Uncharacterized protein conserved in bacteria|uniref:Asp23/Gls24 family envelope stress response protein n=1 Tax=Lachnoanaerobaculum sp. TaxID=2049030 RepID=UPI0025B8C1BB|nr:Asp23/Gls24 family envelope stress response protein [Lachnoanaerobaculum sp.]MBS5881250.1 Asp23/Gls24 family envelope stress response protein [Lachnoanaerobaculum sp.]
MADTMNIKDNFEVETNENGRLGEVKIADEVVAVIAGIAATEVEGVDSMAGNPTKEIVGKLSGSKTAKSMRGVKVEVNDDKVCVDLAINVSYNYNIPEVSEKVQERVKNAIENMTGLTVLEVNIKIAYVVAE